MVYVLKGDENNYIELEGRYKGKIYIHGREYNKEDILPECLSKFNEVDKKNEISFKVKREQISGSGRKIQGDGICSREIV